MLKNNLISLAIIITIFFSYNCLLPRGTGFHELNNSEYTLTTYETGKNNKWSTFRDDKNGRFFIHPGEQKASRGIFVFEKSGKLKLKFSIRKDSTVGDIEFTVKKNKKEFDRSIVTVRHANKVILDIEAGDNIEIIADKHGVATCDWGSLKIEIQETSFKFKNFLIPFLWSILFIFLFGKKHTYIAINSYIIFILIIFAEKLNFGILSFDNIFTYTLLLFSMTFIFTFLYQELTGLKKFKIASTLSFFAAFIIYVIPLFFVIYALNFDSKVTKEVLYAVFQSNSVESYEYVSDFISIKYICLFIFITTIVATLLYKQEKKETLKIEKSLLMFITIAFLSMSLAQLSQLRLPMFVIEGFDKYSTELRLFRQVQEKRKSGEIKFSAIKKNQGETYFIVIGESLNKRHMGIYGYLRDTTPFLSKMNDNGELLIFNGIYSSHTHTGAVLIHGLTESNQYNKKNFYDSLSIIEVLNKADIETYWLTNQSIYGVFDNFVSVIASSVNHLVTLNKSIGEQATTQKLDGALIKEVKKVLLEKTDKNRVIFIHLIGNHGSYSSRYPSEKFTKFKGKLKPGDFGTKTSENGNINYYDNSVLYNDYVVSSILKELQKEKGVNGFIYMPDHADDVVRCLGHNSTMFTYEMTQIPMIAWFSRDYKEKYGSRYSNLLSNRDKLYSNDMLYDTMIGMFGIETDRYNSKYDFTSNDYKLNPEDALVLFGERHYIDKSNYIYWQKVNAKYLIDTNQSSRVFPHRVNSIGKLKDIWNDGFRSFEVDVRFGDNNTSTFEVGHDLGDMGGIGLEEFLSSIDSTLIQRVWLDFKNLDKNNYKGALARLEYLNKKFNIKSKFTVESGTKSEFFKEFRKAKWHTSYYMPTGTIVTLLKEKKVEEMRKLAIKIAQQVKRQNLSALSFDCRLNPFVKEYLEFNISDEIEYHTWYAPFLSDVNFKNQLLSNKLYLDERVKTLLTPYKSLFNLDPSD